jgi:SAM-dependent methyltransferase
MKYQSDAFLEGAGDDYFRRNRQDFGNQDHDPVSLIIDQVDLKPKSILEVGCANGWRLVKLKEKHGCEVRGVDPSEEAITDGNKTLGNDLSVGVASALPYPDGCFDLVIMGFCMWLCDPGTWLRIAGESDRVLADTGHLLVHDYVCPRPLFWKYAPDYASTAEQAATGWLYDYRKLWLSNPTYTLICEGLCGIAKVPALITTSVLKKDIKAPFLQFTV